MKVLSLILCIPMKLLYFLKLNLHRCGWNTFPNTTCLFFLFLVSSTLLVGCFGSTLCTKGDTKQGLFFDYGKIYGRSYVDIGAYPTFVPDASWVKKLIVEDNGFLAVTGQKTIVCEEPKKTPETTAKGSGYCKNRKQVERYTAYRYIEGRGYEEWPGISKNQWENIQTLEHQFSVSPEYFYENCRYRFFGRFFQLLEVMQKI